MTGKKKSSSVFKNIRGFWLPVIIISLVVTLGYQTIYASNPWMEIVTVIKAYSTTLISKPAPELTGITTWFNTPDDVPLTLQQLRGRVVLIDFWTYSCINCKRDVPYINVWYEKYRDQGLVVIGVHTPEFRFEQDAANVLQAIGQYGIQYPVAMDNEYKTWRAYHNQYWPAKYLIDKNGTIVYRSFGEGRYDETEQKIKELLAQPAGKL